MKNKKVISVVLSVLFVSACAEKGKPVETGPKKISTAAPQKVTALSTKASTEKQPIARPKSAPIKAVQNKLPPGHPPMPKTHAAKSQPTSVPASLSKQAPGVIKGRIEIAESLRGRVKGGTTLFISVRRYAGEGKRGMIMAAKKLPVGGATLFPLDFTVSQRDVMMGGTKLVGPVSVSARIDQDGDAISKQPGDIEGAHKGMIQVGKDRASIMLDVLRQ